MSTLRLHPGTNELIRGYLDAAGQIERRRVKPTERSSRTNRKSRSGELIVAHA
jgi:hypothetical protein